MNTEFKTQKLQVDIALRNYRNFLDLEEATYLAGGWFENGDKWGDRFVDDVLYALRGLGVTVAFNEIYGIK